MRYEVVFFMMAAVIALLGWFLHSAWREIDDLYEEIDELKEEADELDRIARDERSKAEHYKTILQESEFSKFCNSIKEATS